MDEEHEMNADRKIPQIERGTCGRGRVRSNSWRKAARDSGVVPSKATALRRFRMMAPAGSRHGTGRGSGQRDSGGAGVELGADGWLVAAATSSIRGHSVCPLLS